MGQFRQPDCFLIFFFTLLIFAPSGIATNPVCYYPNGFSVDANDLTYQPCKYSNGGTYMCCATDRTNAFGGNMSYGMTADHCLPNGLCLNSILDSDGSHTLAYWRDMCTAVDWSTGGCLDVCVDPKNNGSRTGTVQLTPCDGQATSTYWCCGENNTACCNTPDAIHISQTFARTPPAISSSSPSSSNMSSSSSNMSSTSSNLSSSSSNLSSGAKAGIGIGVAAGVIAVIALAVYFLRRRKRTAESSGADSTMDLVNMEAQERQQSTQSAVHEKPVDREGAYEKPAGFEDSRFEKPAGVSATRYELHE